MVGGRRVFVLALAAAVALGAGGCKKKSSGKPKVAVSIFPLWDIARRVAGDRLDVVLVLPPGKSEHGYEPTPKEVARMSGAKLAFLVGLGMDGWAVRIIEGAGGGGVKQVALGEAVPVLTVTQEHVGEEAAEEAEHAAEGDGGAPHEGEEHDEHEGHAEAEPGSADPHFWLDPTRMAKATDRIAAELAALDPAGKADFEKRAAEVKQSLEGLDRDLTERAKKWTKKTIVTFHASMGYFAARYGLTIGAVIEPFPGTEPTAKYVAEVLGAIKATGAAALFSEPQLDRGPAKTIADQAGIPLGELDPVGGGEGKDSYEKLLYANATELDKFLP